MLSLAIIFGKASMIHVIAKSIKNTFFNKRIKWLKGKPSRNLGIESKSINKNNGMNCQSIHLYTLSQSQGTWPRNPWSLWGIYLKRPDQFAPAYGDEPKRSGETAARALQHSKRQWWLSLSLMPLRWLTVTRLLAQRGYPLSEEFSWSPNIQKKNGLQPSFQQLWKLKTDLSRFQWGLYFPVSVVNALPL